MGRLKKCLYVTKIRNGFPHINSEAREPFMYVKLFHVGV